MRLSELEPAFYGAGGPGVSDAQGRPVPAREGLGLLCRCPCGCGNWLAVAFWNPLDGGPPHASPGEPTWQRKGDTIETLTLSPSILRSRDKGGCGWHGFIRDGGILTV